MLPRAASGHYIPLNTPPPRRKSISRSRTCPACDDPNGSHAFHRCGESPPPKPSRSPSRRNRSASPAAQLPSQSHSQPREVVGRIDMASAVRGSPLSVGPDRDPRFDKGLQDSWRMAAAEDGIVELVTVAADVHCCATIEGLSVLGQQCLADSSTGTPRGTPGGSQAVGGSPALHSKVKSAERDSPPRLRPANLFCSKVITGESRGTVKVRHAISGSVVPVLQSFRDKDGDINMQSLTENLGSRGEAFVHAICTSDRFLWCGFSDGSINVFDTDCGFSVVHRSHKHSGAINSLISHRLAGGDYAVFSASVDWTVLQWNVTPTEFRCHVGSHNLGVRALCIARLEAESVLCSASDDRTVRVWAIDDDGKDEGDSYWDADTQPNSTEGSRSAAVRKHRRPKRNQEPPSSRQGPVDAAAAAAKYPIMTLHGHRASVICVEFCRGFLWTGSDDGTIKLWDLKAQCCLQTLTDHNSPVVSIVVNGPHVWTSSKDGVVIIRDGVSVAAVRRVAIPQRPSSYLRSINRVQDLHGSLIWVSATDGCRVWFVAGHPDASSAAENATSGGAGVARSAVGQPSSSLAEDVGYLAHRGTRTLKAMYGIFVHYFQDMVTEFAENIQVGLVASNMMLQELRGKNSSMKKEFSREIEKTQALWDDEVAKLTAERDEALGRADRCAGEGQQAEKTLQEQLYKSEERWKKLQMQLDDAAHEHESEIASLKQSMTGLTSECEQLKTANVTLEERLDQALETKRRVEKRLQQAEDGELNVSEELNTTRRERVSLEGSLDDARQQAARAQKECDRLAEQLRQVTEASEEQLNSTVSDTEAARKEMAKLTAEVQSIRHERDELKAALSKVTKDAAAESIEALKAREAASASDKLLHEYTTEIEKQRGQLMELQRELRDAQQAQASVVSDSRTSARSSPTPNTPQEDDSAVSPDRHSTLPNDSKQLKKMVRRLEEDKRRLEAAGKESRTTIERLTKKFANLQTKKDLDAQRRAKDEEKLQHFVDENAEMTRETKVVREKLKKTVSGLSLDDADALDDGSQGGSFAVSAATGLPVMKTESELLVAELRAKLHDMVVSEKSDQEQLAALRESNAELKELLEKQQEQLQQQEQQQQQQEQQLQQQLQQQEQQLQQQLQQQQQQQQQQEEDKGDTDRDDETAKKISQLQDAFEKLENEHAAVVESLNSKLESSRAELERNAERAAMLQKTVVRLEDQQRRVDDERLKVTKAQEDVIKEKEKELQSLRKDLSKTSEKARKSREQLDQLADDVGEGKEGESSPVSTVREKLRRGEHELAELRSELKERERVAEDMQKELTSIKKVLERTLGDLRDVVTEEGGGTSNVTSAASSSSDLVATRHSSSALSSQANSVVESVRRVLRRAERQVSDCKSEKHTVDEQLERLRTEMSELRRGKSTDAVTIDELQARLTAVTGQMESLKKQSTRLAVDNRKVIDELSAVAGVHDSDDLVQLATAAKEKIRKAEKKAWDAEKELDNTQTQVEAASKEAKELSRAKERLAGDLAVANEETDSLRRQNQVLSTEKKRLNEAATKDHDLVEELREKVNKMRQAKVEADDEITRLRKIEVEAKQLKNRVSRFEKDAQGTATSLAKAEAQFNKLTKEVKEVKEELATSEAELTRFLKRVLEVVQQYAQEREQLAAVNKIDVEDADLDAVVDVVKDVYAGYKGTLQAANARHEEVEAVFQRHRDELTVTQSELHAAREIAESKSEEIDDLGLKLSQVQAEYNEIRTASAAWEIRGREKDNAVRDLESEVKARDYTIERLKREVEDLRSKVSSLTGDVEKIEQEWSAKYQDMDGRLSAMMATLHEAQDQHTADEEVIALRDREIGHLKNQLAETTERCNDRLRERDRQVQDVAVELAAVEDKLKQREQDCTAAKKQTQDVVSRSGMSIEKLKLREEELKVLKNSLTDLEQQLDHAHEKIKHKTKELGSVKDELGAVKDALAAQVEDERQRHSSEVSRLTEEIEILKQENINSAKSRGMLSAAERDLLLLDTTPTVRSRRGSSSGVSFLLGSEAIDPVVAQLFRYFSELLSFASLQSKNAVFDVSRQGMQKITKAMKTAVLSPTKPPRKSASTTRMASSEQRTASVESHPETALQNIAAAIKQSGASMAKAEHDAALLDKDILDDSEHLMNTLTYGGKRLVDITTLTELVDYIYGIKEDLERLEQRASACGSSEGQRAMHRHLIAEIESKHRLLTHAAAVARGWDDGIRVHRSRSRSRSQSPSSRAWLPSSSQLNFTDDHRLPVDSARRSTDDNGGGTDTDSTTDSKSSLQHSMEDSLAILHAAKKEFESVNRRRRGEAELRRRQQRFEQQHQRYVGGGAKPAAKQ